MDIFSLPNIPLSFANNRLFRTASFLVKLYKPVYAAQTWTQKLSSLEHVTHPTDLIETRLHPWQKTSIATSLKQNISLLERCCNETTGCITTGGAIELRLEHQSTVSPVSTFQQMFWPWSPLSAGKSRRRAGCHIPHCTLEQGIARGNPWGNSKWPRWWPGSCLVSPFDGARNRFSSSWAPPAVDLGKNAGTWWGENLGTQWHHTTAAQTTSLLITLQPLVRADLAGLVPCAVDEDHPVEGQRLWTLSLTGGRRRVSGSSHLVAF